MFMRERFKYHFSLPCWRMRSSFLLHSWLWICLCFLILLLQIHHVENTTTTTFIQDNASPQLSTISVYKRMLMKGGSGNGQIPRPASSDSLSSLSNNFISPLSTSPSCHASSPLTSSSSSPCLSSLTHPSSSSSSTIGKSSSSSSLLLNRLRKTNRWAPYKQHQSILSSSSSSSSLSTSSSRGKLIPSSSSTSSLDSLVHDMKNLSLHQEPSALASSERKNAAHASSHRRLSLDSNFRTRFSDHKTSLHNDKIFPVNETTNFEFHHVDATHEANNNIVPLHKSTRNPSESSSHEAQEFANPNEKSGDDDHALLLLLKKPERKTTSLEKSSAFVQEGFDPHASIPLLQKPVARKPTFEHAASVNLKSGNLPIEEDFSSIQRQKHVLSLSKEPHRSEHVLVDEDEIENNSSADFQPVIKANYAPQEVITQAKAHIQELLSIMKEAENANVIDKTRSISTTTTTHFDADDKASASSSNDLSSNRPIDEAQNRMKMKNERNDKRDLSKALYDTVKKHALLFNKPFQFFGNYEGLLPPNFVYVKADIYSKMHGTSPRNRGVRRIVYGIQILDQAKEEEEGHLVNDHHSDPTNILEPNDSLYKIVAIYYSHNHYQTFKDITEFVSLLNR